MMHMADVMAEAGVGEDGPEALALLQDLRRRGLRLECDGEQLHVAPAHLITEEDRDAIRRHKRALVPTYLRKTR